MIRNELTRWFQAPPLAGVQALVCMFTAVGIPTIVRVSVDGVVTGCEFTPYLPFILISAILLRWWQAAAVALVSVAILGGTFGGTPSFGLPCFFDAAVIFLASSTAMIALAVLIRHFISAIHNRGADESAGGIVFSLEKGEVWASWYGQGAPVCLGSQGRVSEMMEDFLAQVELGKRLGGK